MLAHVPPLSEIVGATYFHCGPNWPGQPKRLVPPPPSRAKFVILHYMLSPSPLFFSKHTRECDPWSAGACATRSKIATNVATFTLYWGRWWTPQPTRQWRIGKLSGRCTPASCCGTSHHPSRRTSCQVQSLPSCPGEPAILLQDDGPQKYEAEDMAGHHTKRVHCQSCCRGVQRGWQSLTYGGGWERSYQQQYLPLVCHMGHQLWDAFMKWYVLSLVLVLQGPDQTLYLGHGN